MKSIFPLIYLFLASSLGIQASSAKDSLQAVIRTTVIDTVRINAWHALGDQWQNQDLDSAAFYYQKAFALSKKKNYPKGIVEYYRKITYQLGYLQGQREEGLALARDYLRFAQQQQEDQLLAKAYFAHAIIHQSVHRLDSAIFFYEKSLAYFLKAGSTAQLPILYGNLATLYDRQELPDLALSYAQRALELYQQEADTFGLIDVYNTLGTVHAYLKDTVKQQYYYRQAFHLAQSYPHPLLRVVSAYNLGNSLDHRTAADSSIYYQKAALRLADSLHYYGHKIDAAIGLAMTYVKLEKWQEANQYYQMAVQDTAQVTLAASKKTLLLEINFELLTQRGEFQKATALFPQYVELQETEERLEKAQASLAFDFRLQKAEQEKKLLAKELEINRQRFWIALLLTSLLMLLLAGVFFILYQRKKQQAKAQTILALQKEQEWISTRANLEGQLRERARISREIHDDLGASLTTMALLAQVMEKKWPGKMPSQLHKIAATAREAVDKLNEIIWSLNTRNDTLHSLVAYIRQFASRFLQDTAIQLECEVNLEPEDQPLSGTVRRNIYLAAKEALHNVVKHAAADRVFIQIQQGTHLKISIQDNGVGMSIDETFSNGNGMQNMQQRMQDIGGELQIKNGQGTCIQFNYSLTR